MKPLRIATLNCLNLALPGRRFYAGVEPYSADEYIAKTQWLAAMLDRLAADVVLLQEVFHEQALSDVVRQSASGAQQWSLAAPLAPQDNAQPRLGIVWRRSLPLALESIAAFPSGCAVQIPEAGMHAGYARPLLKAELSLPGGGPTLALVNVHLKSRRPDFVDGEDLADPAIEARARLRSLIRRGAEAAALRRLLLDLCRQRPVPLVVAGDFNDSIDAVTTQIVAAPACEPAQRRDAALRLFDAFEVVVPAISASRGHGAPLTHLDAGVAERIDHILVSEEFTPSSASVVGRVVTVEVLADHLFERRRGGGLDRVYSDHAAVSVALALAG